MFVEDKTTEFQREYADGCAMSIFSAQPHQSDMNTPQGAFPAAVFLWWHASLGKKTSICELAVLYTVCLCGQKMALLLTSRA